MSTIKVLLSVLAILLLLVNAQDDDDKKGILDWIKTNAGWIKPITGFLDKLLEAVNVIEHIGEISAEAEGEIEIPVPSDRNRNIKIKGKWGLTILCKEAAILKQKNQQRRLFDLELPSGDFMSNPNITNITWISRYNITLDFQRDNLLDTAFCVNDAICKQMLLQYNSETAPAQYLCNSFSCDSTELQLLEDSVTEIQETYPCPECTGGYVYINDEKQRTWQQARDLCINRYETDLATITSPLDMQYAMDQIGDGPSPWMGLTMIGARLKTYWYEFLDGTPCPSEDNGRFSGACLGKRFWLKKMPRECTVGSKCTRILPDLQKIDNDRMCSDTLKAVLCNCPGSGHGDETIRIVEREANPYTVDYYYKYFDSISRSIEHLMTYGAYLSIFVLILYTVICCWYDGNQKIQACDKIPIADKC